MPPATLLYPHDVVLSQNWGLSGGRVVRANSRAQSWTSYTLELLHLPTGIRARGQVPPGDYSRTAMVALRQALYHRLIHQLSGQVLTRRAPQFQVVYGGLRDG